ncbi:MAG TPA: FtsX-like permease family protein [Solirubrobacteraceae bacterium]|jgi:hypothetical protein|nr:FtsX-like permease family protein [Solirubrobacteraceae bacterium]
MRRGVSDLLLGARLAATGGTDSRLRAGLTAIGVGFGVALLLFAASVPNMIGAHEARSQARMPKLASAAHASLYEYQADTSFRANDITVLVLQQAGPDPPLPPGLSRIPAPGQMLVSPALEHLLQASGGTELARRLHARVSGTIGERGLNGPAELFAYVGAAGLRRHGGVGVRGFGHQLVQSGHSPLITLLVIMMVVALLLPVGVFVATASRFGSEQRNSRLAALRLLGLDRSGTARVASGEALFGAAGGVALGVIGFVLILRPLVPHTDIAGVSVFAQDVNPSPGLTVLALLLVPVAAVAFALLAMRQVAIEPLGVSRRGRPPRRRLVWRLATPGLGFLLLATLVGAGGRLASAGGEIEASAGIVLVLVGVCALLPWLVEAAVLRADGGPVAWLLAVRRLRLDHGTSGRVVGAIGLAVAGAIALQTVFSGADHARYVSLPASQRGLVQIGNMIVPGADAERLVAGRLRSVHGVLDSYVIGTGRQSVTVASCSTIVEFTGTSACGPQSSYVVSGFGSSLRPGQLIRLPGRSLRVPAGARRVSLLPALAPEFVVQNFYAGSLVLTPGAAARLGVSAHTLAAIVRLSPAAGADDRLRDAVARIDPLAEVTDVSAGMSPRDLTIAKLRRILTAGAVAVLLVIGASLLVSVIEQLRERRRVLAVMSAFGTRASTLAASVLWQTALPVLLGLTLAIVLGAALGAVLMEIAGLPVSFDWGSVALLAGAGVAVVAAVTGLTLPILLRQISPEALRAE